MAQAMGIGALGGPKLVYKRKFRWTMAITPNCQKNNKQIPYYFVKLAARPNLSVEETEINFLNAKTWIPGKGSWETITVTFLDVAGQAPPASDGSPGGMPNDILFNWLASVYNFSDPVQLQMGSQRADYTATGILTLYDGCGTTLETWTIADLWPTSIQFGELDYTSSDTVDIELTLRYSQVQYKSSCPGVDISNCCTASS